MAWNPIALLSAPNGYAVGVVPAGSTTPTITHNLGTTDVSVQVREVSTGLLVPIAAEALTNNTVRLTFTAAPTSGQYRYLVLSAGGAGGTAGGVGAHTHDEAPRGIIARARRASGYVDLAGSSGMPTSKKVTELSAPLTAGRAYRVSASLSIYINGSTNGFGEAALRVTTDGSTPSSSSPIIGRSLVWLPPGGMPTPLLPTEVYTPSANVTARFLLTANFTDSTRTGAVYAVADWPVILTVEDLGVDPGVTGTPF